MVTREELRRKWAIDNDKCLVCEHNVECSTRGATTPSTKECINFQLREGGE